MTLFDHVIGPGIRTSRSKVGDEASVWDARTRRSRLRALKESIRVRSGDGEGDSSQPTTTTPSKQVDKDNSVQSTWSWVSNWQRPTD